MGLTSTTIGFFFVNIIRLLDLWVQLININDIHNKFKGFLVDFLLNSVPIRMLSQFNRICS